MWCPSPPWDGGNRHLMTVPPRAGGEPSSLGGVGHGGGGRGTNGPFAHKVFHKSTTVWHRHRSSTILAFDVFLRTGNAGELSHSMLAIWCAGIQVHWVTCILVQWPPEITVN